MKSLSDRYVGTTTKIWTSFLWENQANFEKTGILLTHDEVTFLCEHLWNCTNADEFYSKMDSMTIDELRSWARKAKKKRGGLAVEQELLSIYS